MDIDYVPPTACLQAVSFFPHCINQTHARVISFQIACSIFHMYQVHSRKLRALPLAMHSRSPI